MKGGTRDTEEVFPNYGLFLDTDQWPSIDNGGKDVEIVQVGEMPPQRAAACLSKLVRWARYEPQGDTAVLDDIDMREEHVRTTELGRELASRSMGLTEPQMHALFGEVAQGGPVSVSRIAAELSVGMKEHFPDWDEVERIALAVELAVKLDRAYLVKTRGD